MSSHPSDLQAPDASLWRWLPYQDAWPLAQRPVSSNMVALRAIHSHTFNYSHYLGTPLGFWHNGTKKAKGPCGHDRYSKPG